MFYAMFYAFYAGSPSSCYSVELRKVNHQNNVGANFEPQQPLIAGGVIYDLIDPIEPYRTPRNAPETS